MNFGLKQGMTCFEFYVRNVWLKTGYYVLYAMAISYNPLVDVSADCGCIETFPLDKPVTSKGELNIQSKKGKFV